MENKLREDLFNYIENKYKLIRVTDESGFNFLYFPDFKEVGWIMCDMTINPYNVNVKERFLWSVNYDGRFSINMYNFDIFGVVECDLIEKRIKEIVDSYNDYKVAYKKEMIKMKKRALENDFDGHTSK